MSLYQCDKCGCIENTALGWYWLTKHDDPRFDNRNLCSACAPPPDESVGRHHGGKWHGLFERVYYPLRSMETGPNGNLREKKRK